MASITSWTRLEPRVRRDDPAVGLAARVHDPLWLLARQWQVGEFTGEDAGSPVHVRARIDRAPITRYRPGVLPSAGAPGVPYDAGRLPLEVLVERETAPDESRRAVDAGRQFLRLLDLNGAGSYRAAYATRYPLRRPPPDAALHAETRRLLRVAAGRVPDGPRLAADLRSTPGALPAEPHIEAADRIRVFAAAQAWLTWLDARLSVPEGGGSGAPDGAPAAWDSDRMEYAFAMAAPAPGGERVLVADEHAAGHLDWHTFDRRIGASLGAAADAAARQALVRTAIPSPVHFRGMPVARWWEFEDAQVNFGAVDAGPRDLLRLVLVGFVLDYGNDWFAMPVELPGGALYQVTSLVVTDSFGGRTLVRPYTQAAPAAAGASRWRMFSLSTEGGDGTVSGDGDDLLLLPPTLPASLHGDPVEEVLLLRDELANLAWAVERRVEEAGGRPLDRVERYQQRRTGAAPAAPAADGVPRFHLMNPVPDYWLPLVPTRVTPEQADIRLVRGRVLAGDAAAPVAPMPLGRLLAPGRPLRLHEEEVPRAGARVTRAYHYVRWTDGVGHLWIGRRKGVGRGEGASGLRFDVLREDVTDGDGR